MALNNCAHPLKHIHKGFKLSLPSRTYNISANHWRHILHYASGHPVSLNYKMLQCFDEFMKNIHLGQRLTNVVFYFDDTAVDGDVIPVKYLGAW